MLVGEDVVTSDNPNSAHGMDVSLDAIHSGEDFWVETVGFDTEVWDIAPGRLPTLKAFAVVESTEPIAPDAGCGNSGVGTLGTFLLLAPLAALGGARRKK